MKNRSGEKVKLTSIDEMLGVLNEESAMEIEISRIHSFKDHPFKVLILSRLVDTFISRISLTMLPVPNPHNTVCVLSWEEARHWQSRSSGYSSS